MCKLRYDATCLLACCHCFHIKLCRIHSAALACIVCTPNASACRMTAKCPYVSCSCLLWPHSRNGHKQMEKHHQLCTYVQDKGAHSSSRLLLGQGKAVIEIGVWQQTTGINACIVGKCNPIVHKVLLIVHVLLRLALAQRAGSLVLPSQLCVDCASDISATSRLKQRKQGTCMAEGASYWAGLFCCTFCDFGRSFAAHNTNTPAYVGDNCKLASLWH